jgi:hypothetical protein
VLMPGTAAAFRSTYDVPQSATDEEVVE